MISPSKAAVDAWAHRELKTGDAAMPLEVRQAALRLVGSTQFGPTFDDSVAVGVALGRPRDSVEVFQQESIYSRDEELLRREIELFADDFFNIPRTERSQRWRELHQKAEVFPWWQTKLAGLEKWLAIDRPAEFVNPLANVLFTTLALSPIERAARRREATSGLQGEELAAAVAEANRAHPEIAAIGGLKEITPKPRVSSSLSIRAGGGYARPASAQPQQRRWIAFTIVFVIITAVRILTSDSTTPRRVAPPWEQGGPGRPQVGNRPDGGFDDIRRKFQFERDQPNRNVPDFVVPEGQPRFNDLPDLEFK